MRSPRWHPWVCSSWAVPMPCRTRRWHHSLSSPSHLHKMDDILHSVDVRRRQPAPPLLPIFRSKQQAELLAHILGEPDREQSVTELVNQLELPFASAHREIERAERAGLVISRREGRTRLVRANTESPFYEPLAELLLRSFGVPQVIAESLDGIDGIDDAYIYG